MKLQLGNFLDDAIIHDEIQRQHIKVFHLKQNNLIFERRIGNEHLQDFFNIIKNNSGLSKYSKQDFCNTFPVHWKVRQKILANNKTGALAIFKIDFQNFNELNKVIKYLRKNFYLEINKEEAEVIKDSLYKDLTKVSSDAAFEYFERY